MPSTLSTVQIAVSILVGLTALIGATVPLILRISSMWHGLTAKLDGLVSKTESIDGKVDDAIERLVRLEKWQAAHPLRCQLDRQSGSNRRVGDPEPTDDA